MAVVIDSVVLEIRPRIQSCSVYISSKIDLTKETTSFKITVKQNHIEITYVYKNATVCEKIPVDSIHFIPNSLSSLEIDEKNVSFRLATTSLKKRFGSFHTEILKLPSNQSIPITQSINESLELNKPYVLKCKNCTNSLFNIVTFDRVLPLPSDNCNPDDWFCHKPCNSKSQTLEPGKTDCFYGFCYIKINIFSLIQSAVIIGKVVHCKRCLAWLGTSEKNVMCFWNCTVKFYEVQSEIVSLSNNFQQLHCSSSKELEGNRDVLKDFKNVILNTIQQTVGFVCKILVECQTTDERTDYLLLWIIDKNINMLKNEKQVSDDNNDDITQSTIVLRSCFAVKLMYKSLTSYTEEVSNWQSDVHVQNLVVAQPMLFEGLKYLRQTRDLMSKNIHASDNFTLSFIFFD